MPERPSQSNKLIAPQQQPTLTALTPEQLERKTAVSTYMAQYALITNRVATPAIMQIYEEALSDLSVDRLKRGLKGWLRNGDRFPWPSDIREAAEL